MKAGDVIQLHRVTISKFKLSFVYGFSYTSKLFFDVFAVIFSVKLFS